MEVVVTTGATRGAKLQSNRHHQQTNTQFFTGRMPFLWPNQQRRITEGKTTGLNSALAIKLQDWLQGGNSIRPLLTLEITALAHIVLFAHLLLAHFAAQTRAMHVFETTSFLRYRMMELLRSLPQLLHCRIIGQQSGNSACFILCKNLSAEYNAWQVWNTWSMPHVVYMALLRFKYSAWIALVTI